MPQTVVEQFRNEDGSPILPDDAFAEFERRLAPLHTVGHHSDMTEELTGALYELARDFDRLRASVVEWVDGPGFEQWAERRAERGKDGKQ